MTAKNKDKNIAPIQPIENQLPGGIPAPVEIETDWRKQRLPKRLQLVEGAHLIAPASTKGGVAKSSTITEMTIICELLGIPYIVASFDASNATLESSLGDQKVVNLDARTPELARQSLSDLTIQARAENALILLDYPGAVDNKESSLLENIQRARVLTTCESFSMIAPITPDARELEGAYRAIQIFKPDSLLLRARRPNRLGPDFESFGQAWEVLKAFPRWECDQWTQAMKEVITRTGSYTHLPDVSTIVRYFNEKAGSLPQVERLDIEDVVAYIEHAAKAVYHFLLKNITTTPSSEAP